MRRRLAIFDFDGTLADSFPWFMSVFPEVAGRFGFRQIDAAEAEALRGCSSREILRRLEVPVWRMPAVARHLRALKAEAAGRIPLFADVPGTLEALRSRGVHVAIVSSDSEASIRTSLGPAASLISHYDCAASLFGKAPKIRATRKALDVSATETLYIGDETRDAEAAGKAGVDFGAVVWGYATPEALAACAPAETFETVEEIRRIGR
jgi:phosphoglycolate phosphatase